MTLVFDVDAKPRKQAAIEEPRLIHEYFERQADLRPDDPALECEGRSLTYAELESLSNKIAHFLKSRRIGHRCLLGSYFNQSWDLFSSIPGVRKACAGYVPFDH